MTYQLRWKKGSAWPKGRPRTLRHPLVQLLLEFLRHLKNEGRHSVRTGEMKAYVENRRREEALRDLQKRQKNRQKKMGLPTVKIAMKEEIDDVAGARPSDKELQEALHVLEMEGVIVYRIDPVPAAELRPPTDPKAKWCPPVRDLRDYRIWTVGIQGTHKPGAWDITDFDSRRYLMLEIPTDEPGQTLEIRMHFNEDLRAEDYEDLRSALLEDPSKRGEILQKFLSEGREEPFRYTTEIRRVKYEVLTHKDSTRSSMPDSPTSTLEHISLTTTTRETS